MMYDGVAEGLPGGRRGRAAAGDFVVVGLTADPGSRVGQPGLAGRPPIPSGTPTSVVAHATTFNSDCDCVPPRPDRVWPVSPRPEGRRVPQTARPTRGLTEARRARDEAEDCLPWSLLHESLAPCPSRYAPGRGFAVAFEWRQVAPIQRLSGPRR
jgi:hypothetical protein